MSSCWDDSFFCQDPEYPNFDEIAANELCTPPSADLIVNKSAFCTFLPLKEAATIGDLTHRDFLSGLKGKVGLYHLWVDFENCTDHDTYTMLCVYVGKGLADARINSHIFDKSPAEGNLYVTFYECPNRMAKYLEQLFLDTYKFHFNKNENTGSDYLYAVWSNERHLLGTELNSVSARSRLDSLDDL